MNARGRRGGAEAINAVLLPLLLAVCARGQEEEEGEGAADDEETPAAEEENDENAKLAKAVEVRDKVFHFFFRLSISKDIVKPSHFALLVDFFSMDGMDVLLQHGPAVPDHNMHQETYFYQVIS